MRCVDLRSRRECGAERRGAGAQGVSGCTTKGLKGRAEEVKVLKKALGATEVFGAGKNPRGPASLKNGIQAPGLPIATVPSSPPRLSK